MTTPLSAYCCFFGVCSQMVGLGTATVEPFEHFLVDLPISCVDGTCVAGYFDQICALVRSSHVFPLPAGDLHNKSVKSGLLERF
ncbi:hypothetical protein C8N36_12045 [Pelagimonas varians]|uniref:Uncharacterized protein n=1 Tax=Pelagimonas varians TaxID=696760 RepID=A0A238L2B8_9RHOB|nr:hypothetical protein C8N36_12045 [Pelagimonas varians]SMX49117.1 hypothetical protein PEV8663_04100 [Pelagimonas varians]